MKKCKFGLLVYCTIGALVGSSLGFGTYFIYKIATKTKKVFEDYVELGIPKTIWFNSGALNADKSKSNKDWDFQIKVFPYQNGKYWLDDDGIKLLREKIWKKLYHGQEITTLDDMVFGNVNMIGESSNGLYFPLTKEVFLNISGWKKHQNLSDEKKIEGIMSTVVHEYGHHIANMYLSTSYSTQSWSGDDGNVPIIERKKGVRKLTNWNPEFTEKFYRNLKYDDKTLLYGKGGLNEGQQAPKGNYVESIAQRVSLYDLFWNANSDRPIKYNKHKQVFAIPDTLSKIYKNKKTYSKIGTNPWDSNDNWYIKYRYSLDEIVTRQLGQLMYVYDKPSSRDVFGHIIREYKSQTTFSHDSFISDARSMNQLYASDEPWNKSVIFDEDELFIFGELFYKDSVFRDEKTTKDLYDNFRNSMGYHKMISNIYEKNITNASVDKETGAKLTSYENSDLNQHKFKITGWTPKEVKGIYYGEVNNGKPSQESINDDLMKFSPEKERRKLWNFNRKKSLFAHKTMVSNPWNNNGENWLPFTTNKYLESRDKFYNGSEFRWWIDEDNNGKATPKEMFSTAEILKKYNKVTEDDVINRVLPVSTFRQTWNEEKKFPRIRYLTDLNDGRKKLVIRLY